jgi:type IV secretory pathway VirB2 component (pilin)
MRTSLILGVALAILGVAVFATDLNSAQAPVEQVRQTLTGRYTVSTMFTLAVGAVLFLAGCILAAPGGWRR